MAIKKRTMAQRRKINRFRKSGRQKVTAYLDVKTWEKMKRGAVRNGYRSGAEALEAAMVREMARWK